MTKQLINTVIFIWILTGMSGLMHAQYDARIEVGHSIVSENLRDGREYALWLAVVGASRKIASIGERGHLSVLGELQFGDVTTVSADRQDIDLAMNIAGELQWKFHPSADLHFSVGSGPAYQSSISPVQADGFLFSNNFALGLRFAFFNKRVLLNPQVRFRHMSNARLKKPNSGIDNILALLGVVIPLGDY